MGLKLEKQGHITHEETLLKSDHYGIETSYISPRADSDRTVKIRPLWD